MKKTRWTLHARDRFLAELKQTGIVMAAARAAGVSRSCVYAKREERNAQGQLTPAAEEFTRLWSEAEEEAAGHLELEARRRAVEGVERYVVSKGQIVVGPDGQYLKIREYSDQFLALLLRARNRAVFGEKQQIEHRGQIETPVLAEQDRAALEDMLRRQAAVMSASSLAVETATE